MNATDREVTEIQSKLATLNKTIEQASADIDKLGSEGELFSQAFAKPEDNRTKSFATRRSRRKSWRRGSTNSNRTR